MGRIAMSSKSISSVGQCAIVCLLVGLLICGIREYARVVRLTQQHKFESTKSAIEKLALHIQWSEGCCAYGKLNSLNAIIVALNATGELTSDDLKYPTVNSGIDAWGDELKFSRIAENEYEIRSYCGTNVGQNAESDDLVRRIQCLRKCDLTQ